MVTKQDKMHTTTESFVDSLHAMSGVFASSKRLKTALTRAADDLWSVWRGLADIDSAHALSQVDAGHMYYDFLRLKPEVQVDTIEAFCKASGRDVPTSLDVLRPTPEGEEKKKVSRGRKAGARLVLAEVIYAQYPTMLRKQGKNKDTRAGNNITASIRAYLQSVGRLSPKKSKGAKTSPAMRQAHALWDSLFKTASETERRMLLDLAIRALPGDAERLRSWSHDIIAEHVSPQTLAALGLTTPEPQGEELPKPQRQTRPLRAAQNAA